MKKRLTIDDANECSVILQNDTRGPGLLYRRRNSSESGAIAHCKLARLPLPATTAGAEREKPVPPCMHKAVLFRDLGDFGLWCSDLKVSVFSCTKKSSLTGA